MNMPPKLASIIEGLRGQLNRDWAEGIRTFGIIIRRYWIK
jgi:hypothetical protein